MGQALLPNLALQAQKGNMQDNVSRVMEQVGSITMYLKYGIVQCHKKSIKLRTQ